MDALRSQLKRTLYATGLALAVLCTTGSAYAQPDGGLPPPPPPPGNFEGAPPPPPPSGGPQGPGGPPEDSPEIAEMVETMRLIKLSEALGLDEEQTIILARRYREFRERGAQLNKTRGELGTELRRVVQAGQESAITEKLEALIKVDDELFALRREAFEAASKGLTATQRAKLYIALQEFDDGLRQLITRARSRWMEHGGPGAMREGLGIGPEDGPPMRPGERFRDRMNGQGQFGPPPGAPRGQGEVGPPPGGPRGQGGAGPQGPPPGGPGQQQGFQPGGPQQGARPGPPPGGGPHGPGGGQGFQHGGTPPPPPGAGR